MLTLGIAKASLALLSLNRIFLGKDFFSKDSRIQGWAAHAPKGKSRNPIILRIKSVLLSGIIRILLYLCNQKL